MNAHQRRANFRVAQFKAEAHNRRARELSEQDPGQIKRDQAIRAWVMDRKAKGLGEATAEEKEALFEMVKAIPLQPDPDRKRWIHSVMKSPKRFTRVVNITVMPDRKTGYEGELVKITIQPNGSQTETRRPLKGLIA